MKEKLDQEYQFYCQECGIITMTAFFSTEDGCCMPVFAGTEQEFKDYAKKLSGEDIDEVTTKYFPLNHESPDDVGYENFKKHYVGEFWCYTDM